MSDKTGSLKEMGPRKAGKVKDSQIAAVENRFCVVRQRPRRLGAQGHYAVAHLG